MNKSLCIILLLCFLSCRDDHKAAQINFCEFEVIDIRSDSENDAKSGALKLPTVFTPNDDGYNDIFGAVGKEIKLFEMKIFKEGNIVFFTRDLSESWDGKINENSPRNGIYKVTISGEFKSGLVFSGSSMIYLSTNCLKVDPSCTSLCIFGHQLQIYGVDENREMEPMFNCEDR